MLLFLVIGDVLGAGIYALVGEVAGKTGGAVWAPFLLALVLAMFTAFSYAELVTRFPGAAGAALYTNRAFRTPFFTFLVAFAVLASGLSSAATIARAFGGQYLSSFVELPVIGVGLVFLLLISLINLRGITESMRFNFGLTLIELGGLFLVITVGVAALANGLGEPARAVEFSPDTPVFLAILGGAGIAFFALLGFEDSVNLAEEIISDFYKITEGFWRRSGRYELRTLAELRPEEVTDQAWAQVIKCRAMGGGADRPRDFFRVCLQDHRIVLAGMALELEALLSYVVTHELVHVVRFARHDQLFEARGTDRFREENVVHGIAADLLRPLGLRGAERVFRAARPRRGGWGFTEWHKRPVRGGDILAGSRFKSGGSINAHL